MKKLGLSLILGVTCVVSSLVQAEMKVGDTAPTFTTQTQEAKSFDLNSRKGSWTVLYFYPKAETPGCTKQACAFRDSLKKITEQKAEVYGVSSDTVEAQAKFHKAHKLNFTLLADPDGKIIELYGSKMPVMKMSKRWTFILDPQLKIRSIEKDVDPAMDADRVAGVLAKLQAETKPETK